jgi:hypothetical protein
VNSINAYNKATELQAVAKNLKLANSGITEYLEAAEENYQQALAEVANWQQKFELALEKRCLKVAHEALLLRNAYKEEARKLEACIDKQSAQRLENLTILDNINKLLVTIYELIE